MAELFTSAFNSATAATALILGLLTLFAGRRLYWVFIGLVGFLLGVVLAPRLLTGVPEGLLPWLSIGVGVVFAILAGFLNRVMVMLSGGAVFALIGYNVASNAPGWLQIAAAIVFGVVGLAVVAGMFEWGLVILSTLVGAFMAHTALATLSPAYENLGWLGMLLLTAVGLAAQSGDLLRKAHHDRQVRDRIPKYTEPRDSSEPPPE
ncbi:MAG: hypothetical protein HY835_13080 [Anaerolineae bacterium]|nr:hypothetical protein [Anaerolineae bacterium]